MANLFSSKHIAYIFLQHFLQSQQRIIFLAATNLIHSHQWPMDTLHWQEFENKHTVGTPYNTVPYTTGSNIARLGYGSQNSWSKLWIPVVKEILNRFPCVLLSREKVSPQENSR